MLYMAHLDIFGHSAFVTPTWSYQCDIVHDISRLSQLSESLCSVNHTFWQCMPTAAYVDRHMPSWLHECFLHCECFTYRQICSFATVTSFVLCTTYVIVPQSHYEICFRQFVSMEVYSFAKLDLDMTKWIMLLAGRAWNDVCAGQHEMTNRTCRVTFDLALRDDNFTSDGPCCVAKIIV